MNYEKEISKEDLKEGNIIMFKVDHKITLLLKLYNERKCAYLNLFQSYTDKTIEEFNNFDIEKFNDKYFELQYNIEMVNTIAIQNKLRDLFNYLKNNFMYYYHIDDKTDTMIIEISKNCKGCKMKGEQ